MPTAPPIGRARRTDPLEPELVQELERPRPESSTRYGRAAPASGRDRGGRTGGSGSATGERGDVAVPELQRRRERVREHERRSAGRGPSKRWWRLTRLPPRRGQSARSSEQSGGAEVTGRVERGLDPIRGKRVRQQPRAERPTLERVIARAPNSKTARSSASPRRDSPASARRRPSDPPAAPPRPRPPRPVSAERPREARPTPRAILRRARSCSCTRPSVSTAASAATSRAQATASAEPTGFRFCGIVEEPPPAGAGRPRRPRSERAGRRRARIFASAPAAIASAEPSSAMRTRFECQGRARLLQLELRREQPHQPRGPCRRAPRACRPRRPARPPIAPPRCAEPASGLDDRDEPARGLEPERRRNGLLQQRSWQPSVVSRCSRAWRAQAAAVRSSVGRTSARARRATSIAALSRMSWLVAPQWT